MSDKITLGSLNEENVKNNNIIPFLKSLGFDESNLSFEDKFEIQWGRHREEIKKDSREGNPRLDILVKENGENRFVIEVKKDGKKLEDEDKWQAISYARLILPSLCPFAILTNGSETRIFDAYTGEDLTEKGIKESRYVKSGYHLELDYEIQNEAISKLVTLSYHNLENLCKYQVEDTMSRLKTKTKSELKNYIPEVFVPRNQILSAFSDFLASSKTCFIINGPSGLGKTNIMCNLAERSLTNNPVLFFVASQITTNIDNCLADEFNWNFSTHKHPEQYVKQLHSILEHHTKDLLVFLDAIDEWPLDNAEVRLSEFVSRIKGKRIRLIVTCKNSRIGSFLQSKAIPLALSQNSFTIDGNDPPSVTLDRFEDHEVKEAAALCKNYFGFTNEINGRTLDGCKDPSLLRAISETYAGKEVPSELNSIMIYQKYLEIKLEKSNGNKSRILEHITKITKAMFDEHCDEIYEADLGSIDIDSHQYCIDYGIITVWPDNKGRNKLKFVSEGLRNFIIANHQERLDNLKEQELEEFARKHISSLCGREFLSWYNSTAKPYAGQVLTKVIEVGDQERAREYARKIIEIVQNDFPHIWKQSFASKESANLLVLYNDERNFVTEYGFYSIPDKESELIWLRKKDWSPYTDDKIIQLMTKYGVNTLTASSQDFTKVSTESYAYSTVFELVKKYLKSRKLDESNNFGIAVEKFFSMLPKCTFLFGLPNYHENYLKEVLPLDVKLIKDYFKMFATGFNDKQNTLVSTGHGRDSTLTLEEISQILETISNNVKSIESTLLPLGDEKEFPQWYTINRAQDYSRNGILEYCGLFFRTVLDEYKVLVESNFPTIKDSLETYQNLPAYVIGQIHKSVRSNKADGMMYAILKNPKQENEIEILDYDQDKIKVDYVEGIQIETKYGNIHTTGFTSDMALDHLFTPYNETGPFRNCPVTNMVYDLLDHDLGKLYGDKYKR